MVRSSTLSDSTAASYKVSKKLSGFSSNPFCQELLDVNGSSKFSRRKSGSLSGLLLLMLSMNILSSSRFDVDISRSLLEAFVSGKVMIEAALAIVVDSLSKSRKLGPRGDEQERSNSGGVP